MASKGRGCTMTLATRFSLNLAVNEETITERNPSILREVLVTGATGSVGGLLIPKLTKLGLYVRALTCDESVAQGLEDAGDEVVVGDMETPIP